MGVFESIVQTMIEMDLLQLFFPWLMITALTYGALNKYDAFEDQSVVGAVAVSVGFISLAGIYMFAPQGLFANFGAAIGFGIFGLLGLAMFLGMAGVNISEIEEPHKSPPAIAGMVIVLVAFVGVLATQFDLSKITGGGGVSGSASDTLMQILTLVFIIIIVALVTRMGGGD